jgi:hypothetical protein
MVGDGGGDGNSRSNGGECRCNIEKMAEATAEAAA